MRFQVCEFRVLFECLLLIPEVSWRFAPLAIIPVNDLDIANLCVHNLAENFGHKQLVTAS